MTKALKLIDEASGGQHVRQPRAVLRHFDERMFEEPEKEVRQYVEVMTKHWQTLTDATQKSIVEKTLTEIKTVLNKPKIDNDLKTLLVVARHGPSDLLQIVATRLYLTELILPKLSSCPAQDWRSTVFGTLLTVENLHHMVQQLKTLTTSVADTSSENPSRRQLRVFIQNVMATCSNFLPSEQKRILLLKLPKALTVLADTQAFQCAFLDGHLSALVQQTSDSETATALLQAAPTIGYRSKNASLDGVGKFLAQVVDRVNLLRLELPKDWPPVETHAFLQRVLEKSPSLPLSILMCCRLPGQEQRLIELLKASEASKLNAHALFAKFLPKSSRIYAQVFSENLEFYECSSGLYSRWTGRHFRSIASGLETAEAERWLRVLMDVVARCPQAMAMAWSTCLDACRKIYAVQGQGRVVFSDPGVETAFLELLAWRGSASALDLRLALRELLTCGPKGYESWMGAYFRPLMDLSPASSGLVVLAPQLLEICCTHFARLPSEGHKFMLQLLVKRQASAPSSFTDTVAAVAVRRRLTGDEWAVALAAAGISSKTLVPIAVKELDTSMADQDLEISSLRAIAQVFRVNDDLGNNAHEAICARLVQLFEIEIPKGNMPEQLLDALLEVGGVVANKLRNPGFLGRLQHLPLIPETALLLRLGYANSAESAAVVVDEIFEYLYENALSAEVLDALSRRFVQVTDRWCWKEGDSGSMSLTTLLSERLLEPIESPFRPRLLLEFLRRDPRKYYAALMESAGVHAGEISLLSSRSRRDEFEVQTVEKVIQALEETHVPLDENVLILAATAMFVTDVSVKFCHRVFVAFAKSRTKTVVMEISDDSDCVIELD